MSLEKKIIDVRSSKLGDQVQGLICFSGYGKRQKCTALWDDVPSYWKIIFQRNCDVKVFFKF